MALGIGLSGELLHRGNLVENGHGGKPDVGLPPCWSLNLAYGFPGTAKIDVARGAAFAP